MGSLIFKGHTACLMHVLYHLRPGGDRVDSSVCTDVFTHTHTHTSDTQKLYI